MSRKLRDVFLVNVLTFLVFCFSDSAFAAFLLFCFCCFLAFVAFMCFWFLSFCSLLFHLLLCRSICFLSSYLSQQFGAVSRETVAVAGNIHWNCAGFKLAAAWSTFHKVSYAGSIAEKEP